ncbi:MAG: bifunctional ornithine acetyltransferase/N-acetylglutamate synthase [Spirochaetaceae bacterium]|jgi:glutamate N-acetyltransferase/amino-acid N-acetyltransferase|nr:bifunctional ornithine acetyltransferase/N-acetylglutamate synthase [Spirochaetaceae bacterium]
MEEFKNKETYLSELKKRAVLPEGFKTSISAIEFYPEERDTDIPMKMNLTLIELDEPTDIFAGVFTKNAFPGYPVLIGRELLKEEKISGVLINNRISNVRCADGRETALKITGELKQLRNSPHPYFPSSTGIIGWKLPEKEICENLKPLVENLERTDLYNAAQAIMTTDAYPKLRSVEIDGGRICAIAKGAGMIEPNMATMLVFIFTDLKIEREELRTLFPKVISKTFNCISIDSDQSTSDTALIFSSGKKECSSVENFSKALYSLCSSLSEDIVRNGEGTSHLIRVKVSEAKTETEAAAVGKALVNSPLTKTAIFGNDPNVGRFIQAMGSYLGKNDVEIDPGKVKISIGDQIVYEKGVFTLDADKEKKLSNYMKDCSFVNNEGFPPHDRSVDLFVSLGRGSAESQILGSDLTYGYVRENADNRT